MYVCMYPYSYLYNTYKKHRFVVSKSTNHSKSCQYWRCFNLNYIWPKIYIERDMNMNICLMYVHVSYVQTSFFPRQTAIKPEPQIAVEIGLQRFPLVWLCRTRKKKCVSFIRHKGRNNNAREPTSRSRQQ